MEFEDFIRQFQIWRLNRLDSTMDGKVLRLKIYLKEKSWAKSKV